MYRDAESSRDAARFAILRAAKTIAAESRSLLAEDEAMALALTHLEDWRLETVRAMETDGETMRENE